MKRFILFAISVLISTTTFAYRTNKNGLKMVSEIEEDIIVHGSVSKCKYVFSYDNEDNLVSIKIFSTEWGSYVLKENYQRIGNEISYQNNKTWARNTKWNFLVDENGNIVRIVATEKTNDNSGAVNKVEQNIVYDYDWDTKVYYVKSISSTYWFKESKSDVFVRQGIDAKDEYGYVDGILCRLNRKEYFPLKNHVNDTNIALNFLMVRATSCDDCYYLRLTEWMNMRRKYLIQCNSFETFEYGYDEEGNLTTMKILVAGKNIVKKIFRIRYVE